MKKTCLLKARRGDPPAVLLRCVEFLPSAERIYEAYWEIDRSEWGAPVFTSKLAVLTEFGWKTPAERRFVRDLWRAMYGEERKVREEQRKAADAAKKEAGSTSSRRGRGRRELEE